MRLDNPAVPQFAVISSDVDDDELRMVRFNSKQEAIDYADAQWGDLPSVGEPDGEEYAEGETPNTQIWIVQVVASSTL